MTHSGQGTEPYVRHDPPLCFNVELDPGEKETLPAVHSVSKIADVDPEVIPAGYGRREQGGAGSGVPHFGAERGDPDLGT